MSLKTIVQILSSYNPVPLPHPQQLLTMLQSCQCDNTATCEWKKYRDKEAIKHSVTGDAEMDMPNSSHQEDQGSDEVVDRLNGEDLCNQDSCNNWMMKQFAEECSPYYLNIEIVQSTSI